MPAPIQTPARHGWLHRHRWFLLFVALPTFVAAIYYTFVASDVYQSESRFVIKAPNQKQAQMSTIANLIQSTGMSGGMEQTNEVLDYLSSRDALRLLQKGTNVEARFSGPEVDWLSGYPQPFRTDTFESLYKFYRKMVAARVDSDTNSVVLTVSAFEPKDAYVLNTRLLDASEQLVNRLNKRFEAKSIAEAEGRVSDAQSRVRDAGQSLRSFRNTSDVLDPTAEAKGVLEVSNALVSQQAVARAKLDAMQRAAPAHPSIPSLRRQIAALGVQISAQTSRAVGTDSGLASKLTRYDDLSLEQEFATQMLTLANASLEQSRTEAQRQQYYLERIVAPNTPDEALYPKRLQRIVVVAAASLALYLIAWMLVVGVLEHAPED